MVQQQNLTTVLHNCGIQVYDAECLHGVPAQTFVCACCMAGFKKPFVLLHINILFLSHLISLPPPLPIPLLLVKGSLSSVETLSTPEMTGTEPTWSLLVQRAVLAQVAHRMVSLETRAAARGLLWATARSQEG